MSRKLVVGLVVGFGLLIAALISVPFLLIKLGYVQVISNLSSGQADSDSSQPVGYEGKIVVAGAKGAISETGLNLKSPQGTPLARIPGGSKARVVIAHKDDAQVQILDGTQVGKKLWIHWEDLQ